MKAALAAFVSALCIPTAQAAVLYTSTDVPRNIIDAGTITSVLNVPDSFSITSLTVELSLTHPTLQDVDIFLINPAGLTIALSTDNGGSGDNYIDTVFDDAALLSITQGVAPFTGSFRPEQALATFTGMDALGTWRLRVTDDTILGGQPGSLLNWSLTFNAAAIPEPQTWALLLVALGALYRLRPRRSVA